MIRVLLLLCLMAIPAPVWAQVNRSPTAVYLVSSDGTDMTGLFKQGTLIVSIVQYQQGDMASVILGNTPTIYVTPAGGVLFSLAGQVDLKNNAIVSVYFGNTYTPLGSVHVLNPTLFPALQSTSEGNVVRLISHVPGQMVSVYVGLVSTFPANTTTPPFPAGTLTSIAGAVDIKSGTLVSAFLANTTGLLTSVAFSGVNPAVTVANPLLSVHATNLLPPSTLQSVSFGNVIILTSQTPGTLYSVVQVGLMSMAGAVDLKAGALVSAFLSNTTLPPTAGTSFSGANLNVNCATGCVAGGGSSVTLVSLQGGSGGPLVSTMQTGDAIPKGAMLVSDVRTTGLLTSVAFAGVNPAVTVANTLLSMHVINLLPPASLQSVSGAVDIKAAALISLGGSQFVPVRCLTAVATAFESCAGGAAGGSASVTLVSLQGGGGVSTLVSVMTIADTPNAKGAMLVSAIGLSFSGTSALVQCTSGCASAAQASTYVALVSASQAVVARNHFNLFTTSATPLKILKIDITPLMSVAITGFTATFRYSRSSNRGATCYQGFLASMDTTNAPATGVTVEGFCATQPLGSPFGGAGLFSWLGTCSVQAEETVTTTRTPCYQFPNNGGQPITIRQNQGLAIWQNPDGAATGGFDLGVEFSQ